MNILGTGHSVKYKILLTRFFCGHDTDPIAWLFFNPIEAYTMF